MEKIDNFFFDIVVLKIDLRLGNATRAGGEGFITYFKDIIKHKTDPDDLYRNLFLRPNPDSKINRKPDGQELIINGMAKFHHTAEYWVHI